jgi:hypothetical protein
LAAHPSNNVVKIFVDLSVDFIDVFRDVFQACEVQHDGGLTRFSRSAIAGLHSVLIAFEFIEKLGLKLRDLSKAF